MELDLLEDAFSNKNDSTVKARIGELLAFVDWGMQWGYDVKAFLEVDESVLYEYLTALRHQKAAPTKASSVMRAVGFLCHCVGCPRAEMAST